MKALNATGHAGVEPFRAAAERALRDEPTGEDESESSDA